MNNKRYITKDDGLYIVQKNNSENGHLITEEDGFYIEPIKDFSKKRKSYMTKRSYIK